jgi:hypothetical protein
MRLFVAILALSFAAGVASASQLDYQPGLIGQPTQYKDFNSHQTLLENSAPASVKTMDIARSPSTGPCWAPAPSIPPTSPATVST